MKAIVALPVLFLCALACGPVTAADSPSHPERDFWAAPSMYRLARFGDLLRSGADYQRMQAKLQADEPARIRGTPGFEAAKRRMKDGVVPRTGNEIQRGPAVPVEAMPYARLLRPAPIKPSLFKAHGDVVLAGEGDEDAFAAVAGARIALVSSKPPAGWAGHQDGPAASGVTGLGDIGLAELSFTPGVVIYELGQDGLMTARRMTRRHDYGQADDSRCDSHYAGARTLAAAAGDAATLERVPGYPHRAPDASPILVFALAHNAPAPHRARIASRSAKVPDAGRQDGETMRRAVQRKPAKVVLREIDLDGDGVADVLLWETPSWGDVSEDFIISSQWYVNVAGKWYGAGAWEAVDCT